MASRHQIVLLALLLAPALTWLPAGSAATGPSIEITHDGGPDGATFAGNLNRFSIVLLDGEQGPAFHNDILVDVTLNNQTLYRTTSASGHDYDGVDTLYVSFPEPGNYTVTARVPTADGDVVGHVDGRVLPAPNGQATIDLDVPRNVAQGTPTTIDYTVSSPTGAPAEHGDALLRIRDLDRFRTVLATSTHGHDGHHALTYAFPEAGTYEVEVTSYEAAPTDEPGLLPARVTQVVEVSAQPATLLPGAPPAPPTRVPLENSVASASGDGSLVLHGTYDPFTSVGTMGRIHLGAVATQASTGELAGHVDMHTRVTGPQGELLFESEDLHSYDGVNELVIASPTVGDYQVATEAANSKGRADLQRVFSVLPPVVPEAAGPQFTLLDDGGDLIAHDPRTLTLSVSDAAGQPFDHSEIELTVREDATGLPSIIHKLHTHETGEFPFVITLTKGGTYTVEADPVGLEPTPTPRFYGPAVGRAPSFEIEVSDLGFDNVTSAGDETITSTGGNETAGSVPALTPAWLAVALGGVAVALGRR